MALVPELGKLAAMSIDELIDLDFAQEPSGRTSCDDFQLINPMLVSLYDAHKEYVRSPDLQDGFKDVICEQMADLLVASSQVSDREMITDVLITLLRQSEKDLKAALADRLSVIDHVPLRLILQFINDDISVAAPVLKNSCVLNDLDLLYIIQSRDTTFWQVIADRHSLNDNVVDALADTHDIPTAKVMVKNQEIFLTEYASNILGELARQDDDLATPLLMRKDVPESVAQSLYSYVGEEIKSLIVNRYKLSSVDVREAVDDVIGEFVAERPISPTSTATSSYSENQSHLFLPTGSMLRAAELFLRDGKLTPLLMVRTLRRGQLSSFIAQLSVYAGLPLAIIIPMIQQKNGQGLAIAAKACGIEKDDFLAIFMLCRKLCGKESGADSVQVKRALVYFERVSHDVAQRLLKRSRQ